MSELSIVFHQRSFVDCLQNSSLVSKAVSDCVIRYYPGYLVSGTANNLSCAFLLHSAVYSVSGPAEALPETRLRYWNGYMLFYEQVNDRLKTPRTPRKSMSASRVSQRHSRSVGTIPESLWGMVEGGAMGLGRRDERGGWKKTCGFVKQRGEACG